MKMRFELEVNNLSYFGNLIIRRGHICYINIDKGKCNNCRLVLRTDM